MVFLLLTRKSRYFVYVHACVSIHKKRSLHILSPPSQCSARILFSSRIGLGLAGVCLVALSVVAALGLLSYMRIKATLIIIEVVPFLVLAVGTDNLFILTHAYEVSNITP